MNLEYKETKRTVRDYLRTTYTDNNLIQVLDHARSGKLAHYSCCCFAGLPFASHQDGKLREVYQLDVLGHRQSYPTGVSIAYNKMGDLIGFECLKPRDQQDALRRRRIIPMVLAEIRRRNRIQMTTKEELVHENIAC